jgi:glycosyltransferase AglD
MAHNVDLSIILPCFNEVHVLEDSVSKLKQVLDRTNYNYEIIIAEDGSTDGTDKLAKRLAFNDKTVTWIHRPKRLGRGSGVANAIKKAKGRIVGFTDTDLSTPAEHIPSLALKIEQGADIATAQRIYKFKTNVIFRFILSKGYSILSRTLLGTPLKDTETGCKIFNKKKILPILDLCKDNHWFWDTEIMVRSYYKGLKVVEMPTLFDRKEELGSSVNVISDTTDYFKKLLNFRKEIYADRSIFDNPTIYNITQYILEGNFYKRLGKLMAKYLKGTTLDICCGTGDLCNIVKGKYMGIDMNLPAIVHAREKYPQALFEYMDATKLDIGTNSFDTVFITDCIHHLNNKELKKVLSEAKRVSRKDIIIIDMLPLKNPISKLLYSLDQGNYIRTMKQQVELIGKTLKIVKTASFVSPRKLYKHSVIICKK